MRDWLAHRLIHPLNEQLTLMHWRVYHDYSFLKLENHLAVCAIDDGEDVGVGEVIRRLLCDDVFVREEDWAIPDQVRPELANLSETEAWDRRRRGGDCGRLVGAQAVEEVVRKRRVDDDVGCDGLLGEAVASVKNHAVEWQLEARDIGIVKQQKVTGRLVTKDGVVFKRPDTVR